MSIHKGNSPKTSKSQPWILYDYLKTSGASPNNTIKPYGKFDSYKSKKKNSDRPLCQICYKPNYFKL